MKYYSPFRTLIAIIAVRVNLDFAALMAISHIRDPPKPWYILAPGVPEGFRVPETEYYGILDLIEHRSAYYPGLETSTMISCKSSGILMASSLAWNIVLLASRTHRNSIIVRRVRLTSEQIVLCEPNLVSTMYDVLHRKLRWDSKSKYSVYDFLSGKGSASVDLQRRRPVFLPPKNRVSFHDYGIWKYELGHDCTDFFLVSLLVSGVL